MKIMKKKFIALMLVLVMVAAYLPTGVARAEDAVEKKLTVTDLTTGFEEADTSSVYGKDGSPELVTDVFHGNNGKSIKLDAKNDRILVWCKNPSMKAGVEYTLKFWVKFVDTSDNFRLRVMARGGSGNGGSGSVQTNQVSYTEVPDTNWKEITRTFTVGAADEYTWIDLMHNDNGNAASGNVYIDDITLTHQETHHVLHVPAKEATSTETGNNEYWYCVDEGCGKYWSDADCATETTLEAVTIPKLTGEEKILTVVDADTTFEEADVASKWGKVGGNPAVVTEASHENSGHSLKLSATNDQVRLYSDSMVAGTEYTITFYYKFVDVSDTFRLRIMARGESGYTQFSTLSKGYATQEWNKAEFKVTPGTSGGTINGTPPYTWVDITHTNNGTAATGTVYIDNLTITHEETHNVLHVPAKEATLNETGNYEYWYCVDSGCGKYWSDADCTIETTLEAVTIPVLTEIHTHTPIHVPAVAATLESAGNIEYWYCSDTSCGKLFLDEECTQETTLEDVTIPKLIPTVSNHSDDAPLSHYSGTVLIRENFEDNSSNQVTKRGNGDFETTNQIYKISGSTVADDMNTYAFTTEKDHTYRMAFYVWMEAASSDYQFDARLVKGTGYAASPASDNIAGPLMAGVSGYTATIDGTTVSASVGTATEKNKWQLVEITWTESVGQSLRAAFRTYAGGGTLYIDDFVISDITEKDKGPSAELELQKITRGDGFFELWFTGTYPKNTTTTPYRSYVTILVNGKATKLNFKHEANSNETLYAYVASSAATLNESDINTIVIPADSVWNKDTNADQPGGAAEFHLESDYTFYTQKVAGNWMDWSSDYTYPEGKDVQYVDMGTGKDYVFSNTTSTLDAGAEGVMAVTKDGAVVYSSSNDGAQASYTTKELGVYEVVRTVGRERYQYKVVLYKRGNTHSALALGESADVLDARDLVALKKTVASGTGVGLQNYKAADANVDGAVNTGDVSFMRRILAGDYDIMATQKGQTIFDQGTMPIIGHGGADPATTDDAVIQNMYQLLGESGINMFVSPEVFSNSTVKTSYTEPALRYADANGLKLMLKEPLVANEDKSAASTVTADTLVKRVGQHNMYNSFAGLYVADEPTYSSQATAGGITKYAIDNYESALQTTSAYANIHSYLNLFPADTTVTNVKNNYENYVKKALTYQAEAISYDMYYVSNYTALINTNRDRQAKEFYTNLDKIRTYSGETPFWTYVQAGTDFGTYEGSDGTLPTRAELYFEANAALAMGAKGINYFRVVRGADYDSKTNGLITQDGQKVTNSSLGDNYNYFDIAQDINRYIAKVDHILMGAENKGVIAMNSTVKGYITGAAITSYNGTTVTAGNDAFVGCFDYYGENVYLVCNTNTSSAQSITLNFGKEVSYISTGMDCQTSALTKGTTATFNVPAGESVLVEVK